MQFTRPIFGKGPRNKGIIQSCVWFLVDVMTPLVWMQGVLRPINSQKNYKTIASTVIDIFYEIYPKP